MSPTVLLKNCGDPITEDVRNQSPPFIMRLGGIHRSAPTTWRQNNEIHVHLRPHQPIISEIACNHLGVRISRPVVHNAQSGGRGGVPSSQSGPPSTPEQPGAALVRRPSLAPVVQPVAIGMTQVVGKQVITRSTGRDLGVISCMWVDPNRGEVVSLDLEDKKSGGLASSVLSTTGGGSARGGGGSMVNNIALGRLVQIGDVVLVQDEQVMYEQPLDGRYGFIVLVGMEVRTRSGEFLGKVRDFSFYPDTGLVSKVMYDDFGLSFLPATFFDTFSIALSDVLSLGPTGIVVSDEAKYRERRETSGMFAAIPSLLRSIGSGGGGGGNRQVAGLLGTSDPYLPQGYSFDQWERDVRRWEMETGLSYDQYVRSQGQPAGAKAGGTRQLPAPQRQSQQPAPTGGFSYGNGSPQQQYNQQYRVPQAQRSQPGAPGGWQQGGGSPPPPQQQQQQQQRQMPPMIQQRPRGGSSVDPRYRNPSPTSSSSTYGSGAASMARGADGQELPRQYGQQQQYGSGSWQQPPGPSSFSSPSFPSASPERGYSAPVAAAQGGDVGADRAAAQGRTASGWGGTEGGGSGPRLAREASEGQQQQQQDAGRPWAVTGNQGGISPAQEAGRPGSAGGVRGAEQEAPQGGQQQRQQQPLEEQAS